MAPARLPSSVHKGANRRLPFRDGVHRGPMPPFSYCLSCFLAFLVEQLNSLRTLSGLV